MKNNSGLFQKPERRETQSERRANVITHGFGFGLSVGCLVLLIVFSCLRRGVWEVVSCSVYGATLVFLYLASTLYHSARTPKFQHLMRVIDHSAIYLLIAGTYTPYLLVPLRGPLGWSFLAVLWGIAVVGIVFQTLFIGRFKVVSTLSYLAMGWLVVATLAPLMRTVPGMAILWLAAGGACYTLGILFYGWKQLRYAHAVWHLFVLAGSLCHFFGILFYVAL